MPDPDPALEHVAADRRAKPRGDQHLPRTSLFVAVMGVIVITVLDIASCTLILLRGGEVPDGLIALGGTGLGALATFLARGQGNT